MKAAICCPGPSLLRKYPGDYGYAGVWAINTAMLVMECDYLSAGDGVFFTKDLLGGRRPRLGVVTMDDHIEASRQLPTWSHLAFTGWKALRLHDDHKKRRPLTWSVQAALLHAFEMGATHIDLYGADGIYSNQVEDITGYAGQDRGRERWKREESDLAETFALLAERGTNCRRFLP